MLGIIKLSRRRNGGIPLKTVNFVFPVQNDESLLIRGIRRTSDFCEEYFPQHYRITIADCGSSDGTERMGRSLAACCENVEYISGPSVIGQVLEKNFCDIIGFLDIDLSAGLEHLLYIDQLLEDDSACMVNGSRFRTFSVIQVHRGLWKNALRFQLILRLLFHSHSGDVLSRFKFFRRETIETLYPMCSDGKTCWYVCAELLLRAEWNHFPIRELAVDWIETRTFSEEKVLREKKEFRREAFLLWKRLLLRRRSHLPCGRPGTP